MLNLSSHCVAPSPTHEAVKVMSHLYNFRIFGSYFLILELCNMKFKMCLHNLQMALGGWQIVSTCWVVQLWLLHSRILFWQDFQLPYFVACGSVVPDEAQHGVWQRGMMGDDRFLSSTASEFIVRPNLHYFLSGRGVKWMTYGCAELLTNEGRPLLSQYRIVIPGYPTQ